MQNTGALARVESSAVDNLFRKITLRIIPFLFLAYVVSVIDRVNIGFAQLQMKQDLGFGDAIYGLGAGIYFIGYFLFEVPSNLALAKIGARRTFSRIMVCWGIVSTMMLFVSVPWQFYTLRFLLGAFEAGFFPGIVLYLTYWYPASRRASVISWFFAGVAIAGLVGGLLSGWLMKSMNGVGGMYGWQWMFLIEGLPACALGVVAYLYLCDSAHKAAWLSSDEKRLLEESLAADKHDTGMTKSHSFRAALTSARVYLLSFVYFTLACGSFTISFWAPTLIRDSGVTDLAAVGLYTAIPYAIGAFGIVLISRRSDAMLERRWHFVVCAIGGALALSLLSLPSISLVSRLAILTAAVVLIYAAIPVFWTLPTTCLSGAAAAGGIALVSSIGQIGGFVSPYAIGLIKAHTGKLDNGLYVMSILLVFGAAAVYRLTRDERSVAR